MLKIIFCYLLLINTFVHLQAQIAIQSSTTNHLQPHKIGTVQNEAVSFEMIISGEDLVDWEEEADFIVFANANSNALFIQANNEADLFDLSFYNAKQMVPIQKKDVKELCLLDLSALYKGKYRLKVSTAAKSYWYTVILR